MTKLPLSAVLITLNEEKNLPRVLKSLDFAQEILVLDSGSQDTTVKVAKELGARVIESPWLGFGPQKKLAAENASFDWILSIDADEEVSPELQRELCAQFSKLEAKTGYLIPRRSFYLGRWIRHGGWYPDYQLRLFHRRFSQWNSAEIHEKVESLFQEKFISPLNHFVFRDISHQVQTNNRYSSLQAQTLLRKKRFSQGFLTWQALTKPVSKFIECYFWKAGFLDGWPGFIIAVNAGHSAFMKWTKVWEAQNKNAEN